jgi:SAM-dependent methyltransferase
MTDAALDAVYADIASYYTQCARRHGSTPRGVDWTSLASQQLRFVQLMKVCSDARAFSLNDLGCGYGALVAYLGQRHADATIDYLGIDVAPTMVRRARGVCAGKRWASFVIGHTAPRVADYSVASGIFNVQRGLPTAHWERFVAATLDHLNATSRVGFAVNFMRAPDNPARAHPMLYQPPAGQWVAYCTTRLGAQVTLLENYGQPEVTLLVRRQPAS